MKKASLTNDLKSRQEDKPVKPDKGPGNRYEADFSLVEKLSSHVSTKPFTTAWAQTLNINFAKLQGKFWILPAVWCYNTRFLNTIFFYLYQ